MIFGEKGTLDLSKGLLYEMHATGEPRKVVPEAVLSASENATDEFYACVRENRKPFADITVAATAALTAILGREAIYRRRSVTWKELGVEV
jgi:negative regulator of sigma E activity